MSEVKRYRFKGAAGEYVYSVDFDAALAREAALLRDQEDKAISIGCLSDRLTTTQSELAALREELTQTKDVLAIANQTLGEFVDDSRVYQQRLTAAEQRNAELEAELTETQEISQQEELRANDYSERLQAAEQRNATLVELLREAYQCGDRNVFGTDLDDRLSAALKPTESGASE